MIQIFSGGKFGINYLELEEALEAAVQSFLGDRASDPYAKEVIFADDTQSSTPPLARLFQNMQGMDIFGGGDKALILKNFDALEDEKVVELTEFIKKNSAGYGLFIESERFHRDKGKGKFKGQGVDYAFYKKNAHAYEFDSIPEWKLNEWLRKRAQKYQFQLSADNALFFLETVGSETQKLDAELKKLRLYLGDTKELSYENLDQSLSRTSEGNNYDLQKFFGLVDKERFILELERVGSERNEWMGVLIGLFYHSCTLLQIRELQMQKRPEAEIQSMASMSPTKFKNGQYLVQASSRNVNTWKKIVQRLGDSIHDIVLGHLNIRHDFELRLLSLFPMKK